MSDAYDLSDKRILFFGGSAELDKVIINQIEPHCSTLTVIEEFDTSAIEEKVKAAISEKGPFDGFVFAVVHSDFKPLQFVKADNLNQIMNDNFSVFVETMRVLKKNRGLAKGASVVAVSSISSVRAMKAKMAFCASKAALDAAVRCLAVELADHNVRINAIQKGATDADFGKAHVVDMLAVRGDAASEQNRQPLGVCPAQDIANMVNFLLSDAVTSMTGTTIVIDGGFLA